MKKALTYIIGFVGIGVTAVCIKNYYDILTSFQLLNDIQIGFYIVGESSTEKTSTFGSGYAILLINTWILLKTWRFTGFGVKNIYEAVR